MKTALFLSIIFFVACSKEGHADTKLGLLTERPWKWAKIEYKENNLPWIDEMQYWPPCKKDDEVIFNRDGSFVLTEGATKCDPSDPQLQDQLRWAFLEGETKIEFDGNAMNIEKLDTRQFIMSSINTTGANTFSSRFTLAH